MNRTYRVRDYYSDGGVWRFNFFKLMGLLFFIALLLMFFLAGLVQAPTLSDPGQQLETAVTLSGTGSPGRTIELLNDGRSLGTTVVGANGRWTFTPAETLSADEYIILTQAVRKRANGSTLQLALGESESLTTFAMPQFLLSADPAEPGIVSVSGSGTAGSQIQLLADGEPIGPLTGVNQDGIWSIEADFEADGEYALSAQLYNRAGELLGTTDSQSLAVVSPPEPIAPLTIDSELSYGLFEPLDDQLATGPVSLAGQGEPGTIIRLLVNGEEVATTPVESDGSWAFDDLPLDLALGENDIAVSMVDTVGAQVEQSEPITLNLTESDLVEAMLPAEPEITTAPLVVTSDLELIDFVLGENDEATGTISWAGTGEPGMTIELAANEDPLIQTIVGANGTWSFDDEVTLPIGEYGFTIAMFSETSDLFELSDVTLASLIPENMAAAVESEAETEEEGEADEENEATGEGNEGEQEEEEEEEEATPALFLTIDSDLAERSALDEITIEGGAPAGTEVILSIDNDGATDTNDVQTVTVEADESGRWRYSATWPNNLYDITATVSDNNETISETVTLDLTNIIYGYTFSNGTNGAVVIDDAFLRSEASRVGLGGIIYFADRSPVVELILDASWSMTLPLDSNDEADRLPADDPNSRIAVAKEEVNRLIEEIIPAGAPFILRTFGNKIGEYACNDNNLMVPLQPIDPERVAQIVAEIEPQVNANTPLGGSLDKVTRDLENALPDQRAVVILLTDGDETCGRNPAIVIEEMIAADIDIVLNIIGFAVDPELAEKLESWAALGNGSYYQADDADQLETALLNLYPQRYRITDMEDNLIASGLTNGIPVELPPGFYTVEILNGDSSSSKTVYVDTGRVTAVIFE